MEPIQINVEDNRKHTQIAFLVDREEFIEDVIQLRKKWLKSEKPFLPKSFEEWFNVLKNPSKTRDLLLRNNAKIGEKSLTAKKLINQGKKEEAETIINELQVLFREVPNLDFKGDLEIMLVRYGVPSTCFKAVARAIISNEVLDTDWQYYDLVLKPSGLKQEQIVPSKNNLEPICELRITPHISKRDWNKIYKANIDKLKELYKNSPLGYRIYGRDTVSNIKRDRNWFWLNKGGMSYAKIWNEIEKQLGISQSGIEKAIQKYKENLKDSGVEL